MSGTWRCRWRVGKVAAVGLTPPLAPVGAYIERLLCRRAGLTTRSRGRADLRLLLGERPWRHAPQLGLVRPRLPPPAMCFVVPSVNFCERRAVSGGRVAGSGGGLPPSARAHGRSSRLRLARLDSALALSFGVAIGQSVAFLAPCEQAGCGRLHPTARAGGAVPRACRFAGGHGPNPAVNRTRRFMASTWRASARRAGYLTRWAYRVCVAHPPEG